jgi:CRISPR-associated protein Cas2
MFILATYDISDDKLRTRLHKLLKRFGEPVQYSVFECIITAAQLARLREEVAMLLEGSGEGNVRYYDMCEECQRQTVALGIAKTTRSRLVYIV